MNIKTTYKEYMEQFGTQNFQIRWCTSAEVLPHWLKTGRCLVNLCRTFSIAIMSHSDVTRGHSCYVTARSMLLAGVCLSVHLSCLCIVSRWLKISSNFFLSLVTPSFQFLTPSAGTNFKRNPFSRGLKYTMGGKNFGFGLKSQFISEMVRDRPIVGWNVHAKS